MDIGLLIAKPIMKEFIVEKYIAEAKEHVNITWHAETGVELPQVGISD
jgi:hypothetical protein